MQDPETNECNEVIEWIRDRAAEQPVGILHVSRYAPVHPSDDRRRDVREGMQLFVALRSAGRERLGEERARRAAKRKEWEADCVPTERGVTHRLLRKAGPRLISILENADGTIATGENLAECAWRQAGSRRSDLALRIETNKFLAEFPADKLGPPADC